MKSTVLFLNILLTVTVVFAYNPCEDSLLSFLKSKGLNDLSDREFEYFKMKEQQCSDYIRSLEMKTYSNDSICQLYVSIDKAPEDIDVSNLQLHIDNIPKGRPPIKFFITPGKHTISLYPQSEIIALQSSLLMRPSVKRKIKQKSYTFINLEIKKNTHIHYNFKCDIGNNNVCDSNEWYYLPKNVYK